MKLLHLVRDVSGVLQPLCFGRVKGVVYGAAFPYLQRTLQWNRNMERVVGRTEMLQLWSLLVKVTAILLFCLTVYSRCETETHILTGRR